MRLCVFVDKPLPSERPTGIGVAAFNMALAVSRRGQSVRYVCRGSTEETIIVNDFLTIQKIVRFSRENALAARRILKNEGYDLIHVHSSSALPALFIGRISGRLTFTHSHGDEPLHPVKLTLMRRASMRLAHRVIATSKNTRDNIIRSQHVPARKVEVAYNGVDTDQFRPLSNASVVLSKYGLQAYDKVLLSVGSLQKRKGQSTVLQVLPQVLKEWPHLVYVNIGVAYNDSYARLLSEKVAALGITRSVRFLQNIPQNDLVALINSADACVHAATREGFGLAVVEEMACGKPVVALNRDSIPEIIDSGTDGLLVEAGDREGLERSLLETLGDQSRARSLGTAARMKVMKRFTWDETASSLDRIYSQLFIS